MILCCPKNTGAHAINRPFHFNSSGMMLSWTRLKPWPRPDDVATIHLTGIRFSISEHRRTVRLTKPIVIEGVSSLNPALCDLYGLKIFVESDRKTSLQTALRRGVGAWEREWRELFLPSADIYMQTGPERRADFLVPGRGILGRTGE
jgi:hypothetical protein